MAGPQCSSSQLEPGATAIVEIPAAIPVLSMPPSPSNKSAESTPVCKVEEEQRAFLQHLAKSRERHRFPEMLTRSRGRTVQNRCRWQLGDVAFR